MTMENNEQKETIEELTNEHDTTVEKTITIGSKEVGETEQEKAEKIAQESEKQARLNALRAYWTYFKPIYDKIQGGMTLEEIQNEIKEKKSNLSSVTRTFALTQEKYIKLWIQDLEEMKNHPQDAEVVQPKLNKKVNNKSYKRIKRKR